MTTIEKLQKFANDHDMVLVLEGECGFGRACVGFTHGDKYVDYQPYRMTGDYDRVPGFEDDRIAEAAPEDAYHKHPCLAVLVESDHDKAVTQLGEWVDVMNELDVEVVRYKTGATGPQLLMSGAFGMAVRPKASA